MMIRREMGLHTTEEDETHKEYVEKADMCKGPSYINILLGTVEGLRNLDLYHEQEKTDKIKKKCMNFKKKKKKKKKKKTDWHKTLNAYTGSTESNEIFLKVFLQSEGDIYTNLLRMNCNMKLKTRA
jgi:pyruvate/2-oxoacid:ferredoxin oxidoreductase beta subunit